MPTKAADILKGAIPISTKRVMVEAVSFVCKRAQHQVTSEGSLNRSFSCFHVANFADENYVRVLARILRKALANVMLRELWT
jgi:hypothetical protein